LSKAAAPGFFLRAVFLRVTFRTDCSAEVRPFEI
jgi:hypothetical protein